MTGGGTAAPRRGLVGGALATIAVRGIDLPSRYGFHLLVAASLGVEQAGRFYIVYSAVTALSGLGRVGLDRALTRRLAVALAHDDTRQIRPLLLRGMALVSALSLLAGLLLYAGAPLLARTLLGKPALIEPLRLAALILLPQNLSTLMAGALAGLHRVGQSQMIYSWLWPSLFCAVALVTGLTLPGALLLMALAFLTATLIGAVLLVRALPAAHDAPHPALPTRAHGLMHDGMAMFSLEMTQLLIAAAPVLILGMLADSRAVGLFSLAWRVALMVNIVVSGIAAMASPRYAALHAKNQAGDLNRAAAQAIGLSLLLTLPAVAVMLAVPAPLLGMFGHGFADGADVLRILALGQILAAASASMPDLLGMTGHRTALRRLNLVSLTVLLLGTLALAHFWSAAGTAWAVSLSIAVNGLGALILARRDLGLAPWRALTARLLKRKATA